MFVGHFAVAFAAKRVTPKTSLGTLVFGAQFLDLIWPPLVLLGVERFHVEPGVTKLNPLAFDSYPISHSLLMALVWSLLLGAGYYFLRRNRRGAAVLGAVAFSHWVLDWLTHRPDLQLVPGSSARVGLGLWNHPALELTLEGGMFLAAAILYAVTTRARDWRGMWPFWGFLAVLTSIWVGNVAGPPPPSSPGIVRTIAMMGLALWLLVPWAAWFDRHRAPRKKAAGTRGGCTSRR